jgi:hypothetical protein
MGKERRNIRDPNMLAALGALDAYLHSISDISVEHPQVQLSALSWLRKAWKTYAFELLQALEAQIVALDQVEGCARLDARANICEYLRSWEASDRVMELVRREYGASEWALEQVKGVARSVAAALQAGDTTALHPTRARLWI